MATKKKAIQKDVDKYIVVCLPNMTVDEFATLSEAEEQVSWYIGDNGAKADIENDVFIIKGKVLELGMKVVAKV